MLPPGRMIEMLASETAMDKGLNSMFRQRKKLTSDYRLQEKFDVCLTLFTARIEVGKGSMRGFDILDLTNAERAFNSLWHIDSLFFPFF